jgi:endonuclease YncB( thermonuclease family)
MRPLVVSILAICLFKVVFTFAAPVLAAPGDRLEGVAFHIVDGDTLDLGRGAGAVRIRLFGIDAPEAGQTCRGANGRAYDCGRAATRRLAELAAGERLVCEERDRDRYERVVAICRLGGMDVNYVLVREGLAFAYRDYSDRYVEAERAARREGLGVFAGTAVPPWEHRRGGGDDVARAGPNGCVIKGNVSGSGRRLYHTPESPDWERTRIDPSKGERWFCDEREARAAGWVKAHR